jgi:hypothetical protein
MNKYIAALIFYAVAFAVIYILNKVSPNAHDGGPGWAGIATLLLGLIMVVLIGINLYKGFNVDKEYFIFAGIHLIILAGGLYKFFL